MKRDRGQDEQVKSRGSKESLLLRDRQTCKERKGYGGTDARRIKNRECDPQKFFSLDLPPVGMFALLDVFWVSKLQIVLRLRPLAKDLSQFVGIDEARRKLSHGQTLRFRVRERHAKSDGARNSAKNEQRIDKLSLADRASPLSVNEL